jgi:hypothetical protein
VLAVVGGATPEAVPQAGVRKARIKSPITLLIRTFTSGCPIERVQGYPVSHPDAFRFGFYSAPPAFELRVSRSDQVTFSRTTAMPWPTPTHMVASAN